MLRIVASRYISHAFVSGGQEDDGEEGEDERERASDVPLREDDAEVLGGECEEHLKGMARQSVLESIGWVGMS